jgi:hypothetical protein
MKIFLSASFYQDVQRAKNFVESVSRTRNLDNINFVFLITGGSDYSVKISSELLKLPRTCIKKIEGRKRFYSQVMLNKFLLASEVCQDDDIYVNVDDDCAFNPYWADFTLWLFAEHPEIQYLSLLKKNFFHEIVKVMSGCSMGIQPDCANQAFAVRWSVFKEHFSEWVKSYEVSDESCGYARSFCSDYWSWLRAKLGTRQVVYIPSDFSLIQHCNMRSSGEIVTHEYATNFDPYCNPFNLI